MNCIIQEIKAAPKIGLSLKDRFQMLVKYNNSTVEQLRWRKPNTRKPVSNFHREVMKIVTKPKYIKPYHVLPIEELCSKAVNAKKALEEHAVHPYFQILSDEIRENFLKSRLIVIFHLLPYEMSDFYDFKVALHRLNLTFIYHKSSTLRLALQGTKYEPLLKLYESFSCTFISDEANFAKLLKAQKKFPFVFLIGGVFDGRILSVTDFKNLAANPNIESHHSQLCGLLSMSNQHLLGSLSQHQQELCSSLQRYVGDQTKTTTTSEET